MTIKYGILAFAAAGAFTLTPALALAQATPESGSQQQPPTTEEPMASPGEEAQAPEQQAALGEEMSTSSEQASASEAPPAVSEDFVRGLQQALSEQGHQVKADGVWGSETSQALREYQQDEGMQATGQIDSETIKSLNVTEQAAAPSEEQQQATAPSEEMPSEAEQQATAPSMEEPSAQTPPPSGSEQQATAPSEELPSAEQQATAPME